MADEQGLVSGVTEGESPQDEKPLPWSPEIARLLEDWWRRATASQYGHQAKADRMYLFSIVLGIPAVILSTIVGTSVFATAANEPVSVLWKTVVGTVSVLAAVLAAIQTYLGFSQLAEKHRVAGFRYANLRRDLTVALIRKGPAHIEKLRREMDKLGSEVPQIGEKQWTHSLTHADEEPRPWQDLSQPAGKERQSSQR